MKGIALILALVVCLSLVSASQVAYVVKLNPSSYVTQVLENNNYSYEIVRESNFNSVDWNDYDVILVNNEKFTNTNIPVNQKPSVIIASQVNVANLREWGWTEVIGVLTYDRPVSIPLWHVNNVMPDLDNPLVDYEYLQSSSAEYHIYYVSGMNKAPGMSYVYVDGINVNQGVPTKGGVVMAIDKQGLLKDGTRTESRGVFFGIPRADLWSDGSRDAFIRSIEWTLEGLDEDEDGYLYNEDCDDRDSSKWVNVEGYVDNDRDGYGYGELIEICSDGELPLGYSDNNDDCNDGDETKWVNVEGYVDNDRDGYGYGELIEICSDGELPRGYVNESGDCDDSNGSLWQNIMGYVDNDNDGYGQGELIEVCSGESLRALHSDVGGDCNDGNFDVNPSKEEVPYDGLDNDCSEGDLKDVDGDGYDSDIANGSDCDDEDSLVWELIQGYRDSDEDGYGIGSIVNVCSDGELPLGYSDNNDDCNDGNPDIYPNASEEENNCVNVAPYLLMEIENQTWNEDGIKILNLSEYFVDGDKDLLNYGIYQTSEDKNITANFVGRDTIVLRGVKDWHGKDWIIFNASDGNYSIESNRIELEIFEVNDKPILSKSFDNVNITQNMIVSVENISEYFVDSEGDELEFRVYGNSSLKAEIVNGSLILEKPNIYWMGEENIRIGAYDGEEEGLSNTFEVYSDERVIPDEVSPELSVLSPENESLIENKNVGFSYKTSDDRRNTLSCGLYINNELKATKNSNNNTEESMTIVMDSGNYEWYISCSDGENEVISEKRILSVKVPHAPVLESIGNKEVIKGNEVRFEVLASDEDGDNLTYSVSGLPSGAVYENNSFSWTPSSAGIYLLSFSVEDVKGLKDSEGIFIMVKEDLQNNEVPEQNNSNDNSRDMNFSDAEVCSLLDNSIKIDIRNPDKGDDYDVGSEIDVEIDLENNGEEDLDLDVKVYIYDLDEGKVVEEESEDIDVDSDDEESLELKIKSPNDIESDNDHAIYVIVSDGERCNSDYVEVEFEKEKHKVVIDKVEGENEYLKGELVSLRVRMENLGENDEDVYLEIKNSELNITGKSEEFEIEEGDREYKEITFELPEGTEEGSYEIVINAIYDDGKDEESFVINVKDEIIIEDVEYSNGEIVSNNLIRLGEEEKEKSFKSGVLFYESQREETPTIKVVFSDVESEKMDSVRKSSSLEFGGLIPLAFLIGIVIVLIFIVVVLIIRRR